MEGQRLGGRYYIERRVGGGGMAIVYKGRDLVLNRPVAIKVLRPQFGTDEDFVQRFRREAQAVASLSHPNIVSVYDVGQDGDVHFMVMEYIEGSTLKDVINARGALPVAEAVRIAVQVCDALHHAHQKQIIHRDIKPHNILIGDDGRVKVTDFGIARAVTSATITHTGSVLGSVHYFSPEQARGGVTAEKSDIYSLGVVLYEMVTGRVPFSGDSPISVALKHLQEPFPDPRETNPDLPQSLENVIVKALAKDPQQRYASAREMLEDLETCLSPERQKEKKLVIPVDGEETKVYPAITPEMLARAQRDNGEPDEEEAEEEEPRAKRWWKRTLVWLGVAVLFFLLAGVGFSYVADLFRVPDVTVPALEGNLVTVAEEKLGQLHLQPIVEYDYSKDVEPDHVISQDPAPGERVKENTTVKLVVSKGEQAVSVPPLKGMQLSAAEDLLKSNKLDYTVEQRESDSVPENQVIEQDPAPNTSVYPSKTRVKLIVSKGKPQVTVPNVIGMSVERAQLALLNAGLAMGTPKTVPSYAEEGTVISIDPYKPGTQVPKGSEIPVTVSSGQLPDDARTAKYPVVVEVGDGEEASVRIVVSDARGDNRTVVDDKINETTEYKVPLVLSPQKNAAIQVLKNGKPYQQYVVTYDQLP